MPLVNYTLDFQSFRIDAEGCVSTGPNPRRSSQPPFSPDFMIRMRKIDAFESLGRLFIKWGSLTAIAFCAYLSINVLAGKHTFADIGVNFLGDIRLGTATGYLVGAGGVIHGKRQKKLKEDTIQQLAPRIKKYETMLDRDRSSSGLIERGRTRPEDEHE